MPRTSITDPLKIADLRCGGGAIGMTICPGKQGPSVFGPPWARDLRLDLDAIANWRAECVVTLMEAHELRDLQVSNLGEEVQQRGMEWLHLPIADLDAPDVDFERRWVFFGHLLRARLSAGGRVLLHCRGGRGRTGMIAARLLMEFGKTSVEATNKVRKERDGAVETLAQEEFLGTFSPPRHDPSYADRLLGCLFGGAVGDALGYAVEFDRYREIQRIFGPAGLTGPILNNGKLLVSDDTQMTLFTAEGLVAALGAGPADPNEIISALRSAYADWLATQDGNRPSRPQNGLLGDPAIWASRAPGTTCLSALRGGGLGTLENPINDSKGCGGVMRIAPIGLVRHLNLDAAFDLGARSAAITHGHPSGYLSAGAGAALIHELTAGSSITESVKAVIRRLTMETGHEEVLLALKQALALAARNPTDHPRAISELGEGWVGEEAIGIALYAALVATSFKEALVIAANHDGDSDSTASIAGQIWGAMHGLHGLPTAWVTKLDVFDALCRSAGALLEIDAANKGD